MPAISISDCTVTDLGISSVLRVKKIVTPATADGGDTIDVSSLFQSWVIATVYNATDKGALEASDPTDKSITLPGATLNEARTIIALGQ